jgi:sec-independent protein translocase protein TatB
MFDMSWGEVLVIGAVALIVIGPKDLPKALRTLGNMTSKLRRMATEFQSQFNDAMREAELDDIKKQVQGLNDQVGSSLSTGGFNPLQTIREELKTSIESTTSLTPPPDTPPAADPLLVDPPPAALPSPVEPSVAAMVEHGVSAGA